MTTPVPNPNSAAGDQVTKQAAVDALRALLDTHAAADVEDYGLHTQECETAWIAAEEANADSEAYCAALEAQRAFYEKWGHDWWRGGGEPPAEPFAEWHALKRVPYLTRECSGCAPACKCCMEDEETMAAYPCWERRLLETVAAELGVTP